MSEPALRVIYLSLELLTPGQASDTHVRAIVGGMAACNVTTWLIAQARSPGKRASKISRIVSYLTLSLRAAQALRGADVAYVRSHPAAALFSALARLMGKPVVHEINGQMSDIGVTYGLPTSLTRLLVALQLWQYRRAAGLIAVTPGLRDWVASLPGVIAPVFVVSNGADIDVFRPDAVTTTTFTTPYAFFFGGLVAWHGIDTMLAAVRHPGWPRDVQLVIAGHGPLSSRVEAAQVEGSIVAAGYVERSVVAGLAAGALVLLCPIEDRGARGAGGVAPLKLFESMACGRPVIVTDLPFQSELVRDGACGLVIAPEDPAALAGAVARIAGDPDAADAMGARGRAMAVARFDWRARAAETADILRHVVMPSARS